MVNTSFDERNARPFDQGHGSRAGHQATDATRHLCSGVHLDRAFRDLVLRRVFCDARRRVAPSYGFDLLPVVRHAWYAWFLDAALLAAVLLILGAAVATGHGAAAVIAVLGVLLLCLVVVGKVRVVADAKYLAKGRTWRSPFAHRHWHSGPRIVSGLHGRGRRRVRNTLGLLATLVLVPVLVTNLADVSLVAELRASAYLIVALVAATAVAGALRQHLLNRIHGPGSLRPERPTGRERVIDAQQTHPTVVDRRIPRPPGDDERDPLDVAAATDLIGCGVEVDRWTIVVPLIHDGAFGSAGTQYEPPPFPAHELVDRLRASLQEIGSDPGPENLSGLEVRDRLYVLEDDVIRHRDLLAGHLRRSDIRHVIDHHGAVPRHFLEAMVPAAGSELVTTALVHATVQGRALVLNAIVTVLTRTPRQYVAVAARSEKGTTPPVAAAALAALRFPVELARLWRLAATPVLLIGAVRATARGNRFPSHGVGIAPAVAVRQWVAENFRDARRDYRVLFGHTKLLEQRVLDAAEKFLEEYGVDISTFTSRATQIIQNSGVLNVSGGDMTLQDVTQRAEGNASNNRGGAKKGEAT